MMMMNGAERVGELMSMHCTGWWAQPSPAAVAGAAAGGGTARIPADPAQGGKTDGLSHCLPESVTYYIHGL